MKVKNWLKAGEGVTVGAAFPQWKNREFHVASKHLAFTQCRALQAASKELSPPPHHFLRLGWGRGVSVLPVCHLLSCPAKVAERSRPDPR